MHVYVYVYSKYSNIYSKITVLCLLLESRQHLGVHFLVSARLVSEALHTGGPGLTTISMSMGNYGCSSKSKQCSPVRGPQSLSSRRWLSLFFS